MPSNQSVAVSNSMASDIIKANIFQTTQAVSSDSRTKRAAMSCLAPYDGNEAFIRRNYEVSANDVMLIAKPRLASHFYHSVA